MFSDFMQHSYFMGIVLSLLVLGVLCQIIIGVLYQKMIRETDNMAVTEHKLLKQCKLKFSNCYELNEGNINISIFVDKFINQIHFMGISLTNIGHLSGQLTLLSVFAAGIGVCKSIIEGGTLGELLPYYGVSLFGLYIYFSVSSLVDAKGKRSVVRTNLIDYLENHLVKHLQLIQEEEMQLFINNSKKRSEKEEQKEETEKEVSSFTGEEQEELEELLREFLA
ncbi:MAG: hypothetical protein HFI94_10315 [Lachnospiraceae bacterium]|jgi:hypothetical protein|nr:hypothetical protein [Lachnospiraceae bacterium]